MTAEAGLLLLPQSRGLFDSSVLPVCQNTSMAHFSLWKKVALWGHVTMRYVAQGRQGSMWESTAQCVRYWVRQAVSELQEMLGQLPIQRLLLTHILLKPK